MKIEWTEGRKKNDDRLYLITTEKKEPISAFRLSLLINQLAINELKIHEWLNVNEHPFFFEKLIYAAIDDAKKGINWAEPKNEAHVIDLCEKYYLPHEKFDFALLRRTREGQIEEFKSR